MMGPGPGCDPAWHRIVARLAIYEGPVLGRPSYELRGSPRPPDQERCELAREWRLQHGADPGFGVAVDSYSGTTTGGEGCLPPGSACGAIPCCGNCCLGICSGVPCD